MVDSVSRQMAARGIPPLYGPDLEFLMTELLTEMSTDPLVNSVDQATFAAQVKLASGDPKP